MRTEHDIERPTEDLARSRLLRKVIQQPEQLTEHPLVTGWRRRVHDQCPADDLVPIPVVGHPSEVVVG
jgi:hypothetical protein